MSAENALMAIRAIECISRIMDICDKYDEEDSKAKRRKIYVKSEDVEIQLLKDVAWKNVECDDAFCPLSMENFNELSDMVSSKVDRNYFLVSMRMRLAITLRFLIAGDSHRLLEKTSHVSRKSVQRIVPHMVRLLADILGKDYLKSANADNDWLSEEKDFQKFWEFPHTLGVLDIKKFRIKSPSPEISTNIILLSILDAHSRFQYIEIIESEENDCHTAYINSRLYKYLRTNKLNIPPAEPLEGQREKTAYFFVGDEITGSDQFVLNAYKQNSKITRSQKAFNYRIRRVRLSVQMAFEIMFYKFKVFQRLSEVANLEKAKLIIKTCCLLHNYLTQKLTQPLDFSDEIMKSESPCAETPKQINESDDSENRTRDKVCQYCVNEGNIAEQCMARQPLATEITKLVSKFCAR